MGLQDRLNFVLIKLLNFQPEASSVFVHEPKAENLYKFCVVINIKHESKKFKGSASGKNVYTTFIKALSELGECIIIHNFNIKSRSGIAGGLFYETCLSRCKSELLERDSFLYHYRNLIPFKIIKRTYDYHAFELSCLDSLYKVSLLINADYLTDPEKCLIIGMGCDSTIELSLEKAHNEFSAMYLNHQLYTTCSIKDLSKKDWERKTDFHHAQSMSRENKVIFSKLCQNSTSLAQRDYDSSLWHSEKLDSPISFLKFIKAEHPDVLSLDFGFPEKFQLFSSDVFHPFW